jgi:hypothetical protein
MVQHSTPMSDASPRRSRRTLLKLGVGSALALTVVGGGAWLWRPGLSSGRLTPPGRSVFRAVARVVLEGSLPLGVAARERAIDAHLVQLDAVIEDLPPATRSEIAQMLALLSVAPSRLWLTGLASDWDDAGLEEVEAALRRMRADPQVLRQQTYHALRDLSNAAFYAQSDHWPLMGYPGPTPV